MADKFYKGHNGLHVDLPKEHLACVYYVNDSDGDTIIYEQNTLDTPAGATNVDLIEQAKENLKDRETFFPNLVEQSREIIENSNIEEVLSNMTQENQDMGLYDEPFDNPMVSDDEIPNIKEEIINNIII